MLFLRLPQAPMQHGSCQRLACVSGVVLLCLAAAQSRGYWLPVGGNASGSRWFRGAATELVHSPLPVSIPLAHSRSQELPAAPLIGRKTTLDPCKPAARRVAACQWSGVGDGSHAGSSKSRVPGQLGYHGEPLHRLLCQPPLMVTCSRRFCLHTTEYSSRNRLVYGSPDMGRDWSVAFCSAPLAESVLIPGWQAVGFRTSTGRGRG